MNHLLLTCNQSPMRLTLPVLRKSLRPLFYLCGIIALVCSIGGFFESMLFFFAGIFVLLCIDLLSWQQSMLRFCNTVEFYDDTILLRNHRGEGIRTVEYEGVLYADAITLRFMKRARIPAYSVKSRYLCLWIKETPPLFEDDGFTELAKWKELFLLAYDENAEAILREKVRFASK